MEGRGNNIVCCKINNIFRGNGSGTKEMIKKCSFPMN
jgi:hypothetical protein